MRTADQRAADEALHEAIIRNHDVTEGTEGRYLLTHWVVVTASVPAADGGDVEATSIGMIYSGGSMPTWQAAGLLDVAKAKLVADWVDGHAMEGDD